MRWLAAALIALALGTTVAHAWLKAGPNVVSAHHRLRTPGPLDGALVSAPASAGYSFRLLRQAYLGTGAAIRLRRASDQAEVDIGFSGSGDFDAVTATAFCAATSCFVRTWYDQSGNARDVSRATAAEQPALVFACQGGLPCTRTTTLGQQLQGTSVAWVAAKTSLSTVARRSATTVQCFFVAKTYPALKATNGAANQWILDDQVSQTIAAAAADGAFHAAAGVVNGAASVLRIDGAETTGTVTGNTNSGGMTVLYMGSGGVTCDVTEAIAWDNYAMTPTERTNLVANQRAYWGF